MRGSFGRACKQATCEKPAGTPLKAACTHCVPLMFFCVSLARSNQWP